MSDIIKNYLNYTTISLNHMKLHFFVGQKWVIISSLIWFNVSFSGGSLGPRRKMACNKFLCVCVCV